MQIHAYSSLYAYATTTLPLPAEPSLNRIHRSETKPRREPNQKLVPRFLVGAAVTAPQRGRCDETNNGAYKPTLGPFAFAREKNTGNVPFAKSLRFF